MANILRRFRKKKSCVDCHFFVKELRDRDPHKQGINSEIREAVRKGDFSWNDPKNRVSATGREYTLMCEMGVWDEGYDGHLLDDRFNLIVEKDRNDCFFWEFRQGVFLYAAKKLYEREHGEAQARKDRRLVVWGLVIAASAFLVSAGSELVRLLLR